MTETISCPSCGSANEPGRKFCGECGTALARACPSCGTANAPTVKFCGECGTALTVETAPAAAPSREAATPAAERRLVSVLFADLVGFTGASEGRDAEETRELLTHYFETARSIVERYGGTVEKFIGDAVMAVWGTPVATEDDAERAVRAALDLVAAMPDLHPQLAARAGVLTGEAAVTLGAEGQGMVAGDLVNTASRVQSAAEPGTVLVGESTRSTAEAAIAFEDAGEHDLKGKAEPMRLWQALRVVANRGGEGRSSGLEAPFVGRDRELRIVKDFFQASAEDGRARLVLVSGSAGIGKSRLAWEFEKYIDGLTLTVWWHRGRCLSYGEGVAYWALAEMVRGRAGILESEGTTEAAAKLTAAIAEHVPGQEDRDWVEPRLAHLLGLADASFEREDLFAAWRLFFECLADDAPTVLVFEDLQWADEGLLDFVEYLVEWSRTKPIFVLGLARPELGQRRSGFGTQTRGGFTGLALEPLSDEAMDALLEGLVPGVPEALRESIRSRAGGIPLYAIETVRMLLNRGQIEPADGVYRLVGEVDALEVPESLHALVASRIDALDEDERRLVQDAAVLGKTFVVDALASVTGRDERELEPTLRQLVRKELFFLEADPRSAERGQYGFLQDLVRHVAYETLARRDRKARHLAAATFFETSWGGREQEIVEVVASHYATALELDPDAEDAPELRSKARETLARAADRAASLGASVEATALFERAAGLADDAGEHALLLERAGEVAIAASTMDRAEELLARARALYREASDTRGEARATALAAQAIQRAGRTEEALRLAEAAYAVLASDENDRDTAVLAAELARLHFFTGDLETALARIESALPVAERSHDMALLATALTTKAMVYGIDRPHEADALVRGALQIALDHDLVAEALRAYNNLTVGLVQMDRADETLALTEEALALARQRGNRGWADAFTIGTLHNYYSYGRWDEAVELARELEPATVDISAAQAFLSQAELAFERGHDGESRRWLERFALHSHEASDRQQRSVHLNARRVSAESDRRFDDALSAAEAEIALQLEQRELDVIVADALNRAAALAPLATDRSPAERVLAAVTPEFQEDPPRAITATLSRLAGVLAALRGEHGDAAERFGIALAAARSLGLPPWVAGILVDYAESLLADDRRDDAAPLLAEAREIAERLQWTRLLTRIEGLERAGERQEALAP
ncbi:MAG: adenylate/guanylate cyclase domain-containing protein [Gaiellaceae bacterium]